MKSLVICNGNTQKQQHAVQTDLDTPWFYKSFPFLKVGDLPTERGFNVDTTLTFHMEVFSTSGPSLLLGILDMYYSQPINPFKSVCVLNLVFVSAQHLQVHA